jgi:hypothetical protein
MNFDLDRPIRLQLRTPHDLVTSLPPLLGFHPKESLVMVSIGIDDGRQVRFALRVDLPPPTDSVSLARHLAGVAAARRSDEVMLVVLGGASAPDAEMPVAELVDALHDECALVGVPVRMAVWAAEVARDAPWRCYGECACSGRLPDPSCAPLAARMVASGQVIYGDRSELERLVAPADPVAIQRRSAKLDARLDRATRKGGGMPLAGAAGFALLTRWVDRARTQPPRLADADVVSLCLALSDPMVRDAGLGFALGTRAVPAERLWSALTTECPDPEAAEPAVLWAFSALMRGDGALANVALERAQQAWPGHRLSALFLGGLGAGVAPGELRSWFLRGIERAEVELAGEVGPR